MTDETATAPIDSPKPVKKPRAAKAAPTFTLAARARELNVSPKSARAAFRRLFADKARKHPKTVGDGWAFPATERNAVDAVLKGIVKA